MSVNSVSFGYKQLEKFSKIERILSKPTYEELKFALEKSAKRPKLEFDKWGHVISTKEKCEEFIKWAKEYDKELLKKAKMNLLAKKETERRLIDEYNANPSAWKLYHIRPVPLTNGLNWFITSRELCNEYVNLQKELVAAKSKMSNDKIADFSFFSKIPTKYPNKMP